MRLIYLVISILLLSLGACDPCRNIDCGEHGDCSQEYCVCDDWWTGESCSELVLRQYEGDYQFTDSCFPETIVRVEFLSADFDRPNRLSLDEYYFEFDSDSTFKIPVQRVGSGYFEGEGSFRNGRMYYDLYKRLSTSRDTCKVKAKRL